MGEQSRLGEWVRAGDSPSAGPLAPPQGEDRMLAELQKISTAAGSLGQGPMASGWAEMGSGAVSRGGTGVPGGAGHGH